MKIFIINYLLKIEFIIFSRFDLI